LANANFHYFVLRPAAVLLASRADKTTGLIDREAKLGYRTAHVRQRLRDKLAKHRDYIVLAGEDMAEIWNFAGT
jgi:phosphoketolase